MGIKKRDLIRDPDYANDLMNVFKEYCDEHGVLNDYPGILKVLCMHDTIELVHRIDILPLLTIRMDIGYYPMLTLLRVSLISQLGLVLSIFRPCETMLSIVWER